MNSLFDYREHYMQDNLRRGDLENYYDNYWNHRASTNRLHTIPGEHAPVRLSEVLKLIPDVAGIKVLDIGCGEGTLGMMLKQRKTGAGISSVGCDISGKSIELAAPHYDRVIRLDAETDDLSTRLEGEKFDYIVCVEILEHIFYPNRALSNLKSVLAEDGHLIISFPNIAWWKYRLRLLSGHFPEESRLYHHAEHLHDFTMHTFSSLMKDSGLVVEEMSGQFIAPRWLRRCLTDKFLNKHMRRHPNFYGYQVIFKTKMQEYEAP